MAVRKTLSGKFECDVRDQYGHKRLKTFATHREAKAYEKQALAAISKGEYVVASKKNLGELAREWYKQKLAQDYRRSTLKYWENHIENLIVPELGHHRLTDLDVKTVEAALANWAQTRAAQTVNKAAETLTAILAMAQRRGEVNRNVAEIAERLKVKTEDEGIAVDEDKVYTRAELSKLILVAEGVTKALVMLLAFTGLRIGEALALSWDAIDLKAARLDVELTQADSDEGLRAPLYQPPKTKSSRRSIPLAPELLSELKVWKLGCPISERNLVFATEEGLPYGRFKVSTLLDCAIKKAAVKRLTPHGLRHTFASLMLAAGKPVTQVSALLGHRSPQITMSVYAHWIRDKESDQNAVADLAASVLGN